MFILCYKNNSFFLSRYTFASGSPDNIKQWKFPDGNFLQNLSGHNAIINSLALNSDNVLVSGGRYNNMSHDMRLPTMWYVRPAKAQTQSDQSLC